jgi:hypothetical protein
MSPSWGIPALLWRHPASLARMHADLNEVKCVKYKPIEHFVLRGTWGKGFRAPSPTQSQQSGSFFHAEVNCFL